LVAQSIDDYTGIGRVVLNLAREFAEAGHAVSAVAQNAKGLPSGIRLARVASFPVSNALRKLCFRLDAPSKIVSLHADVVIAFGVGSEADIVVAGSCHRAGMEIREARRESLHWKRNFGLYDAISLRDERGLFTSARTRRIVAVSALVKDQIERHYQVSYEKTIVIPNGIEAKWLEQVGDRNHLRSSLGCGE
jgi:glycosyltransferase involved in cell wall biosynthesis